MRTAKEKPCEPCEPIGTREIAALLEVKHDTVTTWRKRGILPEPQWFISGNPAWNKPTIDDWAKSRRGPGRPPKVPPTDE